jgi:hypothetical protein
MSIIIHGAVAGYPISVFGHSFLVSKAPGRGEDGRWVEVTTSRVVDGTVAASVATFVPALESDEMGQWRNAALADALTLIDIIGLD